MSDDLAKRAVACKGWRWMPGMLAIYPDWQGFRVSHVGLTGMHGICRYPSPMGGVERAVVALPVPTASDVLPDLTDPATLGCLLALVRDAHRDAYMAAGNDGPVWVVRDCDGYEVCRGTSERAVLVAALEAAA